MQVLVILEAKIRTGVLTQVKVLLRDMLPETRAQEGCRDIDVYLDPAQPEAVMLVERWDSLQHYKKYRLWRIKSGTMDKFTALLQGSPQIRILERV